MADRRACPRRHAAGALLLAGLACGTPHGDPVRVVVPPGSSLRAAADSLARAGVVRSGRLFRLYASLRGQDRALKAGTYELRPGTGWNEVLATLTEGRAVVASITIPEGFDLSAIVPLLAQRLEVPAESATAAVSDSALRRELGVPTPTLEGYLFPATYTFDVGTTARVAVAEMAREFERRWRPAWTARLDTLGMTRHQVVTLASIVEKEARVPDERPLIAAVYCNRLRAGMLLQADPTVQYALGTHVERVLYSHLGADSPYNTYRRPGLPPGPIASPGTASLEAALYPADVRYLFFVARPDGRHEFRNTFAEHAQARQAVRRLAERAAQPGGASAARPDSAAAVGRAAAGAVTGGMDTARAAAAAHGDSTAVRARCR
jgi:UPF0755 protein